MHFAAFDIVKSFLRQFAHETRHTTISCQEDEWILLSSEQVPEPIYLPNNVLQLIKLCQQPKIDSILRASYNTIIEENTKNTLEVVLPQLPNMLLRQVKQKIMQDFSGFSEALSTDNAGFLDGLLAFTMVSEGSRIHAFREAQQLSDAQAILINLRKDFTKPLLNAIYQEIIHADADPAHTKELVSDFLEIVSFFTLEEATKSQLDTQECLYNTIAGFVSKYPDFIMRNSQVFHNNIAWERLLRSIFMHDSNYHAMSAIMPFFSSITANTLHMLVAPQLPGDQRKLGVGAVENLLLSTIRKDNDTPNNDLINLLAVYAKNTSLDMLPLPAASCVSKQAYQSFMQIPWLKKSIDAFSHKGDMPDFIYYLLSTILPEDDTKRRENIIGIYEFIQLSNSGYKKSDNSQTRYNCNDMLALCKLCADLFAGRSQKLLHNYRDIAKKHSFISQSMIAMMQSAMTGSADANAVQMDLYDNVQLAECVTKNIINSNRVDTGSLDKQTMVAILDEILRKNSATAKIVAPVEKHYMQIMLQQLLQQPVLNNLHAALTRFKACFTPEVAGSSRAGLNVNFSHAYIAECMNFLVNCFMIVSVNNKKIKRIWNIFNILCTSCIYFCIIFI